MEPCLARLWSCVSTKATAVPRAKVLRLRYTPLRMTEKKGKVVWHHEIFYTPLGMMKIKKPRRHHSAGGTPALQPTSFHFKQYEDR